MHKMEISAQKNDFPLAVGARITGVDDQTFSVTGESFSAISLPGANSHQSKVLQEDDVSLGAQPPCLNSTLNTHTAITTNTLFTCVFLCASQPTNSLGNFRGESTLKHRHGTLY